MYTFNVTMYTFNVKLYTAHCSFFCFRVIAACTQYAHFDILTFWIASINELIDGITVATAANDYLILVVVQCSMN